MKIRNGFVSNSSSSSFVVVFPKDPKTVEELEIMLFGNTNETFWHPYSDEVYPSKQVAEYIFSEIQNQTKNDIDRASEEFADNDFDWRTPEWKKNARKNFNQFFNTRKNKLKKINGEKVDEVFYVFGFSDNDGDFQSALEHGDVFRNLKHEQFSHH